MALQNAVDHLYHPSTASYQVLSFFLRMWLHEIMHDRSHISIAPYHLKQSEWKLWKSLQVLLLCSTILPDPPQSSFNNFVLIKRFFYIYKSYSPWVECSVQYCFGLDWMILWPICETCSTTELFDDERLSVTYSTVRVRQISKHNPLHARVL